MQQRYRFSQVFEENPDGSLTPRRQIHINGISFGPGVSFQRGVAFGGIDFHLYRHFDIAGHEENGILVIEGFLPMVTQQ